MTDFVWVQEDAILAVHDRLLAVHGGAAGIRDRGLLDSAMARPQNLTAYGTPDVFQLAAAYASGIVHNHPFVDGNKRAGFMAAFIFLSRNGWDLLASEVEATRTMLSLAAGETSEEQFAAWLGENCRRIEP
ncbi:MAG: type II toxin-antitoxin system death-on-curing family toxin [bacterium]|nr:type II toxin-antitoxin system death-on-curing family toxin [bacterium]